MPEISVRGLEMPESPIRKLAPLAAAAKNVESRFTTSTLVNQTSLPLNAVSMH